MHYHLTNWQFLASCLVLFLIIVFTLARFLLKRRAKTPPFLNYFGSEYDRVLRQLSSMSDGEDWRSDRQSRFTPFRLRDSRENDRD